jgi:hypothetical protein
MKGGARLEQLSINTIRTLSTDAVQAVNSGVCVIADRAAGAQTTPTAKI